MSRNAFDNTRDLGHDTDGWIDAMLGAYAAALPPALPNTQAARRGVHDYPALINKNE